MESNDESIRLLKKRMHQQMNVPSEKDIIPENIQYYASSLMMQREDAYQKESMRQKEDEQQEALEDGDEEEAAAEEKEEYEEMPVDAVYIKRTEEIPPVMKDIKVPETIEAQHERAKNEYEKVLHAADEEEIFGFRRRHWLNIKG